ncbi:hypothetical protein JO41_10990 [Treponema sp. OMZ 838]|uniref:hypothetical protein n=1 Tax=Treponema sp. OMZ 838 TaxID=1539298 RepID=UPI0005300FAD|nr:hypothetical protein [Treponema sp. OMZ 838]AIW90262.1 hypothetical protein JO41_10990 [Treponema sp. OMZ 838]
MTDREWQAFSVFRTDFKAVCRQWLNRCGYEYSAPDETTSSVERSANRGKLHLLQQAAAADNKTPAYPQETPIVYNHSLDEVQASDRIKLIIISDNPGKNEQLHKNQRYLVGQAGKVAEGFFRRNPELAIDFRREVIILNKTPVHTAKTKELNYLLKHGGEQFRNLFEETQEWLAANTAALQRVLGCPFWLVGYGELRKKSLFTAYAEELRRQYGGKSEAPVYVFQHFSMNCFAIDFKKLSDAHTSTAENLRAIGLLHRKEILGW